MIKKLILLLLFIPLVFSCSSEELELSDISDNELLLDKIEIKYDDGSADGFIATVKHQYNDSFLIKIESEIVIVNKFIIDGKRIEEFEYQNENMVKWKRTISDSDGTRVDLQEEFEYNEEGFLKSKKRNSYDMYTGEITGTNYWLYSWSENNKKCVVSLNDIPYYTYTYDNTGNIISESGAIFSDDYNVWSYSYDNKKNPLLNIKGNMSKLDWLLNFPKNNILTYNRDSFKNNSLFEKIHCRVNNYEYNNKGYPTKQISKNDCSGINYEKTFFYN